MQNRLKELREEQALSSREMSKLLGISHASYSQYELGINNISTEALIRLARYHKTSIDYLLMLTDDRRPYPSGRDEL